MIALTIVAGVRIFLGAAALPLFTNVDEQAHFDLVHKFATGHWPGAGDQFYDEEVARLIALYGSPEYMTPEKALAGRKLTPLWAAKESNAAAQRLTARWASLPNYEAHSPPVYYLLAGAWYDLGWAVGLRGGYLAYWVRFLNVLLYPAVVALSYFFVRRFFPGQSFLRLSVPTLLAAFPQDVFFAINSDVASPLFFLAALFLLLEWHRRERAGLGLGVAVGLAVALTCLVKSSNAAVLVLLVLILVDKAHRLARAGQLPQQSGAIFLTGLAATVPILGWLGRNVVVLGDLTGSGAKMKVLGWTYKPISEWTDHPLFTPAGFGYFWNGLIQRFWRGETVWHLEQNAPAACDWFFVACSVLFITGAAIRWWRRRKDPEPDAWLLVAIAVSVLFLATLSLLFDFGPSRYPSRANPFFISGRLIIGVLVPFSILLVRGLEFLTSRLAPSAGTVALAAVVVVSLASRFKLLEAAWGSEFNWFHLR